MVAPCNENHQKLLFTLLVTIAITTPPVPAQRPEVGYPDVERLYSEPFDEDYFSGTVACGWDALRFWMRDDVYRGNLGRLENMHKTQFERLLLGEPNDVEAVNHEIRDFCRRKQVMIEEAWNDPNRRHPAAEVCSYQTELIPLAMIALRVPDRLTPETHTAIKDALLAFRPATPDVVPAMYMHAPGYNGANAHDYLGMLVMSAEVTDDRKIREAAYWALRRELENLNLTGDMQEFNLLESHWCSSMAYEPIKRFLTDPEMARMARLISERIWLNRFLTWSAAVERITGPGSRMAPGAWLGCSGDRLQFATGVEKPIWLNVNFAWGPWDKRQMAGRWPLNDVEAMVPQLPSYLQDVAWRKQLPHDLQCSVQLIPWMERFPRLDGISHARPAPTLAKYVNYQTDHYAVGSVTQAWDASTCMVYMSAWWNDNRHGEGAPLGCPQRFCALYPHYVFNGASFLDRVEMYFENRPDEPARDEWSHQPGPFMREFAEYGRAGSLQHKNTVIFTYSGRKGDHTGNDLVADKARRVSAGMFLFRWQPGTDGLFINRKPVQSLPTELHPDDWWFIQDTNTYAAVRPLAATHLRGPCKTVLEQRQRHVVLYQDNYVGDTIEGITDEQWVKARSGFVVELGDAEEYGSFQQFQETILTAKVEEDVEGFVRHIQYERPGLTMEMKWHCYEETYLQRRINGRDDIPIRYLRSPEFAVGSGALHVHDAALKTQSDETVWLLSCAPSQTYVAYQPHPHRQLPLHLDSPIGRIECARFPFGKLVLGKASDRHLAIEIDASYRPFWSSVRWRAEAWQELGTLPSDLLIHTEAEQVTATINEQEMPVIPIARDGRKIWRLDPYARIPRVGDRAIER